MTSATTGWKNSVCSACMCAGADGGGGPSYKKNRKVQGTITFEQDVNKEMWDKIVSVSMVGSGVMLSACLVRRESGTILACSPSNYTPSTEQISIITNAFENSEAIEQSGFVFVEDAYKFERCRAGPEAKNVLLGSNEEKETNIGFRVTHSCYLVGVWYQSKDKEATGMMSDICDLLKQNGI